MRTIAKLFRRRMRRMGVIVTWEQARSHAIWQRDVMGHRTETKGRQFKMPRRPG